MSPPTQDPQRLQRRRIQAGLNRTELAKKVGISKSHMGRLERGLANASPRVLKRFAEFFDCKIPDLMPASQDTDDTAGAA